jgi:hypothetical protein
LRRIKIVRSIPNIERGIIIEGISIIVLSNKKNKLRINPPARLMDKAGMITNIP